MGTLQAAEPIAPAADTSCSSARTRAICNIWPRACINDLSGSEESSTHTGASSKGDAHTCANGRPGMRVSLGTHAGSESCVHATSWGVTMPALAPMGAPDLNPTEGAPGYKAHAKTR